MTKRIASIAAAGVMMLGLAGSASAGPIPTASLAFMTPTGIVSPTASIQVWMTLSLTSGSGALATDSSGNVVGLTVADFSPFLFDNNYDPTGRTFTSNINTAFTCTGTFTTSCTTGPPYDFGFAFNGSGQPLAMTWPANLNLADGSSTNYLFGTFSPTGGGPVAPGTYTFYNTSVFIQVYDDLDTHVADIPLGETGERATFQRTVNAPDGTPVPEPASLLLLGTGVAAMAARRRFAKRG